MLLRQAIRFITTSGIGWVIDFSIYTLLIKMVGVPLGVANFISAVPAVTFVFITSTKKIFVHSASGVSLKTKYAIYLVYQLVLVAMVSALAQFLHGLLLPWISVHASFLVPFSEVLMKVLITPITMFCNFLVMKALTERL